MSALVAESNAALTYRKTDFSLPLDELLRKVAVVKESQYISAFQYIPSACGSMVNLWGTKSGGYVKL